jgi:hypothetical protein
MRKLTRAARTRLRLLSFIGPRNVAFASYDSNFSIHYKCHDGGRSNNDYDLKTNVIRRQIFLYTAIDRFDYALY